MQGETAFRTASPAPVDTGNGAIETGDIQAVSTTTTEVPYLDYSKTNGTPFSVSYFGLGDTWGDPVGGFPKEIETIEGYFANMIERGEIANSTNAVKDRLKEILKVTNMGKEERNVIRIETIAAYIKFLTEKDGIQKSIRRYGSS